MSPLLGVRNTVKLRLMPHCVHPLEHLSKSHKPIINSPPLPTSVTCSSPDSLCSAQATACYWFPSLHISVSCNIQCETAVYLWYRFEPEHVFGDGRERNDGDCCLSESCLMQMDEGKRNMIAFASKIGFYCHKITDIKHHAHALPFIQ